MVEIAHRTIEANGIRIHFAEAGEGPLVLMCHGFPESWYSWRDQLQALAEAGYHAVAPDMRGYGETDRPDAIEQYTLFHLVGDMVALVGALGADKAVIAGHDWGAPVAWHAAQFRPDRFRAVMALSVPFRPRGSAAANEPNAPNREFAALPALFPDARRRRGRAGARPSRLDPQDPLLGFGRRAGACGDYGSARRRPPLRGH